MIVLVVVIDFTILCTKSKNKEETSPLDMKVQNSWMRCWVASFVGIFLLVLDCKLDLNWSVVSLRMVHYWLWWLLQVQKCSWDSLCHWQDRHSSLGYRSDRLCLRRANIGNSSLKSLYLNALLRCCAKEMEARSLSVTLWLSMKEVEDHWIC